jgi:hypothetical protein
MGNCGRFVLPLGTQEELIWQWQSRYSIKVY